MDIKEQILDEAITLFNREGFDFKMDNLAKELHISKKTIYKYYANKEDIFRFFIHESFASVHQQQEIIYADKSLGIKEKLLAILNTNSKYEDRLPIETALDIKNFYPSLNELIIQNYSTQWDRVISLLKTGMAKGIFKPDLNISIVVTLLTESMQMVHRDTLLSDQTLSYRDAIKEATKIIVDGISL